MKLNAAARCSQMKSQFLLISISSASAPPCLAPSPVERERERETQKASASVAPGQPLCRSVFPSWLMFLHWCWRIREAPARPAGLTKVTNALRDEVSVWAGCVVDLTCFLWASPPDGSLGRVCTPGMQRFATAVGRECRHSASLGNWREGQVGQELIRLGIALAVRGGWVSQSLNANVWYVTPARAQWKCLKRVHVTLTSKDCLSRQQFILFCSARSPSSPEELCTLPLTSLPVNYGGLQEHTWILCPSSL